MHFDPIKTAEYELASWKVRPTNNSSCSDTTDFHTNLAHWMQEMYGFTEKECEKVVPLLTEMVKIQGSNAPDEEWDAALDATEQFYTLVAKKLGIHIDPRKCAESEIKWWKSRNMRMFCPEEYEAEEEIVKHYAALLGKSADEVRTMVEIRMLAFYERDLAEGEDTSAEMVPYHWNRAGKYLYKYYTEVFQLMEGGGTVATARLLEARML
jgi:hypothetical protein